MFRVLGPIEVHHGERPLPLGGPRQVSLLAVLLVNANRPVTNDELIEALWADGEGGTPKSLQMAVARLRKALKPLADGDEPRLRTVSSGYVLDVRPGELDADVFRARLDEGQKALKPDRAAALLTSALGLWRGTAYSDVKYETFAQNEIQRLEGFRLTARMARLEADLALGRQATAEPEIAALGQEHPMDEHLAGLHMLALYRGGRQTEALDVYQRLREKLQDLGLDPGQEVQQLQIRILKQDPALTLHAPSLPMELDATTDRALSGRRDELSWLREQWQRARAGEGALVTATGPRGIGKTRLIAEVAREVHEQGATVLYASGGGPAASLSAVLDEARHAFAPTLLVVDDADAAGSSLVEDLSAFTHHLPAVPVLTYVAGEDPNALASLHPSVSLRLEPLGVDAIHTIASSYGPANVEVPTEWLLEASGGVPARVHELSGQWARREAARRVSAAADRTAAGRAELRSRETELADEVHGLQATRERTSLPEGNGHAVVCPFKGLTAFDASDAPYYFGRERLVAALVARLVGAPLLGVIGPSGSGKSSALRAGLLPALAAGVLPGSEDWTQLLIRPGEHPPKDLPERVGTGRFVVAVDQFEEVFTACRDESEREAFVSTLVGLARETGRGVVVLALRADQYGRCTEYAELSSMLAANQVLVQPMRRDELRRAVECPAERAGLRVEPKLTEALVEDVHGAPGGLPLLSAALLELWQRREGRRLSMAAYEEIGGVSEAVKQLAEVTYERLDGDQQMLARDVLMRLVAVGADGTVERRRLRLRDLEPEREDLQRVVEVLAEGRLVTISDGALEVAHESLLRKWPRLASWIDENRDGLRVQDKLGEAAEVWHDANHDADVLYRGAPLSAALEWRAAHAASLTRLESEFLDASERRWRRERKARRRRVELAFAGLGAALAVISVVAVLAVRESREAQRQRDIAASRELAANASNLLSSDPGLSLALARLALQRWDTNEAEDVLRRSTFADRGVERQITDGGLSAVATSRDGGVIAIAAADGTARVIDARDGHVADTLKAGDRQLWSVSLSPDAKRIALGGDEGVVSIANVDGSDLQTVLRLGQNWANDVAFNPDGSRLAVAGSDGTVRLVDADGRSDPIELSGHSDSAWTARFDQDGARVVSASLDGTVRVWTLGNGSSITLPHPAPVNSAAFSPDGIQIATVDAEGALRVWTATGEGEPVRVQASLQPLTSVTFSPDGERVATAGEDGIVRLWEPEGGPALGEFAGHRGPARSVAFGARGTLVSVGDDGTLRTWTPASTANVHAPLTDMSLSPDGRRVAGGGQDGVVRVVDLDGTRVRERPGHGGFTFARFAPDARSIISASIDGTVRLWRGDASRARVLVKTETPQYAAAIDPRNTRAATGDADGAVTIWPLGGGADVVLKGHRGPIYDLQFSPDGRHLISASEDGTARIWSVATGKPERVLRGHRGAVNSARYDRSGGRVLTAGTDGTVRVWDVASGRAITMPGHDGAASTARFNPAGDRIVSGGEDGTVRVWSAAGGETLVTLYDHGRSTGAEFTPDGRSVVSAGDDGIVRVSSCEVCGSLGQVMRIAQSRPPRSLTAAERERFVPSDR